MSTLHISISENYWNKYGIKNSKLTFNELKNLINKENFKQNLNNCIELSRKYGLSNLTMDDITKEVNEVRRHAKNRN